MYQFISVHKNNFVVREEDINQVEKHFNIVFPKILRQFYLEHNGDSVELCKFRTDDFEHEIFEILPLKYGDCTVEDVMENDREDEIIPCTMIPIANDRGGDYYYWDLETENVYLYYCDDIENPIYICDSIKSLFDIMNRC